MSKELITFRSKTIPGFTELEAELSGFIHLADISLFLEACGRLSSRKPNVFDANLPEGAKLGGQPN